MSTGISDTLGSHSSNDDEEAEEYNLYLGFMIPIGAILVICIMCLFIISWQLLCPKCSKKYCPKVLLESRRNSNASSLRNNEERGQGSSSARRPSLALVRRYSDFPPSYDALNSELPPSYNSVVIIEEEAPPADRSSRSSGIRTYVYDPSRRVSIEIHDEDTIRVVEELLSRRRSSSVRSLTEPPGYGKVIHLPERYSTVFSTER